MMEILENRPPFTPAHDMKSYFILDMVVEIIYIRKEQGKINPEFLQIFQALICHLETRREGEQNKEKLVVQNYRNTSEIQKYRNTLESGICASVL